MAQQIKKKFLSPEVINYFDNQIDAVENSLSAESLAREAQDGLLEGKIDQEILDRQSGDSSLQSQINTEKGRIDAILSASEADKDSFAEIVALINSVDTENDNAFSAYALSNNARVSEVESDLAQEVLDRQAGDTQTLNSAKAYTDAQIAAIPGTDLSNYYTKSEVDVKDAAINQKLDDLDVYAQDIRNDVDSLDVYAQDIRSDVDSHDSTLGNHESRISELESRVDGPQFANGSVVVGTELGYVDLDRQYLKLMSCSNGRLAAHEGEDFTVSVVDGKTRLTWINSFANPDGEERVETGDKIFFVGAY